MPESTVTLDVIAYDTLQQELAALRQNLQACEARLAIASVHDRQSSPPQAVPTLTLSRHAVSSASLTMAWGHFTNSASSPMVLCGSPTSHWVVGR
ncbi:MAG: hypothetical protein HC838_04660 [Spirulinaceae cyanobacterium RM2_2_10]|nr:hypothetical protein [Spirulinaceae cyanobacterium RM2_2_10]